VNLLFGGTGFIGSALAERLVKEKEEVVSVSRAEGNAKPAIKHITMDLQTENLPVSLLDRAKNIFILVGKKGTNFNREAEKRLLEKIIKPLVKGKQRIFYFSSIAVYGNSAKPATEQSECKPLDEYGKFKVEAELLVHNIIPRGRWVILRPTNVYGSPGDTGFIGTAMTKITRPAGTQLEIHGGGRFVRDYIFVDDVVGACLTIRSKNDLSDIINVATGHSVSGNDVIQMIEHIAGHHIPRKIINDQPAPKTVLISNAKLKNVYGYNDFTRLEEGLKKTLARYLEVKV
jgi:nucleoside-diphosphate-sugar epimerase